MTGRSFAARASWVLLATAACGAGEPPVPEPPGPVPTAAPPPMVAAAPTAAPAPTGSAAAPHEATLPDGSLPSLAGFDLDAGVRVSKGMHAAGVVPQGLGDGAWITAPWLALFDADSSAVWPGRAALEVQGIVIDGTLELRDAIAGGSAPRPMVRWTAFRAPGGAITLRAVDGTRARAILFAATRDRSPMKKHVAPSVQPTPGPRPAPIEVVDLHDRAALRWGKGQFEARIAWDGRGPAAALDVIVSAPGAAVAEHAHPGAWECLFPLRVAGEVVIEGKPRPLAPGGVECIPPDVKHAWKPAGTEPLVAIQFYAPTGAEQRFRDLAAKEVATSGNAP